MNKIFYAFLFTCASWMFVTLSHARPININILSVAHHIAGGVSPDDFVHYGDRYDMISNKPVQYGLEWREITYPGAYSSAGNFSVSAFGAFACSGYALAESTYSFQPEFSRLELDVKGSWAGPLTPNLMFELTNLSSGKRLLSALYDDNYGKSVDPDWGWGGFSVNELYSVVVDPHDIYQMHLYVDAFDSDFDSNLQFNIKSTPVPEPATFLLVGIGIGGLVGSMIRRKRYHFIFKQEGLIAKSLSERSCMLFLCFELIISC